MSSSERSDVVPSTARGSVLLLHVSEKRLDAGGPSDGVVFLELDLGGYSEPQLACNARAKVRSHAIESVERRLLLGLASKHAYVNAGVAKIGTDLRSGNRNEANDARILCRFSEECRNLDADRFGDAVRSAGVTQRRPPLKSASAPLAPSYSTRAHRQP